MEEFVVPESASHANHMSISSMIENAWIAKSMENGIQNTGTKLLIGYPQQIKVAASHHQAKF